MSDQALSTSMSTSSFDSNIPNPNPNLNSNQQQQNVTNTNTTSTTNITSLLNEQLQAISTSITTIRQSDLTTLPPLNQQQLIFSQLSQFDHATLSFKSMLNNFETQQHQFALQQHQLQIKEHQFIASSQLKEQQFEIQNKELILKEQQLIADYKGKEQQFQLEQSTTRKELSLQQQQLQNNQQLLDLRNEKLNTREDNLLIREEQVKVKEARLDLQEEQQSTNNITNNNHHILALFEQGQQLVSLQDRLSQVPVEVWDQVELLQQRRLLEEDKEQTMIAYHGLQDHLDEHQKHLEEHEKALEKKLKKLNKLQSRFEPQMALLFQRQVALLPQEQSLDEREIALQAKEDEYLALSQQLQEFHNNPLPSLRRQIILQYQLDSNSKSIFPTKELQNANKFPLLFRLVPLHKNVILSWIATIPCSQMFFYKTSNFHTYFATDSKAGLLPTKDSKHKIYFSSPHVLDGEWVQVFGEGTDITLFDPETFAPELFINKASPLIDKIATADTDRSTGQSYPYKYTLDIKWEY